MFEPPKIIETTVFARLPDKYRLTGKQTDWLKVQRRGENLHSFLEGPSFDRAGNLYVVDVPFGRIFRISPDGIFDIVVEYDGEPNGLKIHPDGRIFIADHKNGILTLDPGSGALSPLVDRDAIEDFKGPNDLVFSSTGDLYFTDQGQTGMQDPTGRVYRLRANGTLEKILEGIPSPNGIVLDNKETAILIAVTRGNAVWRAPMLLDGSVSKVGIFIQMSGGVGPDGMAIDEAGNLAVCHPGMGATWLFSAAGEPLYRIRSCADNFPTNCAFGGPDRRSLFIVESHSGSILRAELPTPGRRMFSHS
ncbi:SMP-30/gluconolactonase/LRE family protein [Nitrobacteraceae bacterium UC4446_H13]